MATFRCAVLVWSMRRDVHVGVHIVRRPFSLILSIQPKQLSGDGTFLTGPYSRSDQPTSLHNLESAILLYGSGC